MVGERTLARRPDERKSKEENEYEGDARQPKMRVLVLQGTADDHHQNAECAHGARPHEHLASP